MIPNALGFYIKHSAESEEECEECGDRNLIKYELKLRRFFRKLILTKHSCCIYKHLDRNSSPWCACLLISANKLSISKHASALLPIESERYLALSLPVTQLSVFVYTVHCVNASVKYLQINPLVSILINDAHCVCMQVCMWPSHLLSWRD